MEWRSTQPFKSGFRAGHGIGMVLVTLMNAHARRLIGNACNPVDSPGPLSSFQYHQSRYSSRILLSGLRLGGIALQWFESYLQNRFQKMVLGDCCSASWPPVYKVLQSSVLFLMLLKIYVKMLGEAIQKCWLACYQYADVVQLHLTLPVDPKEVAEAMNWFL